MAVLTKACERLFTRKVQAASPANSKERRARSLKPLVALSIRACSRVATFATLAAVTPSRPTGSSIASTIGPT
jgi:hypothetical protein